MLLHHGFGLFLPHTLWLALCDYSANLHQVKNRPTTLISVYTPRHSSDSISAASPILALSN